MSRYFMMILLSLGLAGCGFFDSNEEDDGGEVHSEAAGFLITSDDAEVLRYLNLQTRGTLQIWTGSDTGPYEITFLDSRGNALELDEDNYFELEIDDPAVLRLTKDSKVANRFTLRGLKAGTANLNVRVMHGDHADFTALPISIAVRETQ